MHARVCACSIALPLLFVARSALAYGSLCTFVSTLPLTTKPLCVKHTSTRATRSNDSEKEQRIERILANRGVGSRTQVAKLIKEGRCFIDGKRVLSPSAKALPTATVQVDGMEYLPIPLLAILHKPMDVESTMKVYDRKDKQTLPDVISDPVVMRSMHPVGRLDHDTTGLLLFSSDGSLTNLLLNPKTAIEREYDAVVEGNVDFERAKDLLAKGVETSDGAFPATLLSSEYDSQDDTSLVRLVVTEGKYRMVRRILHNIGHSVLVLHRLRYGAIELGELDEGDMRYCTDEETAWAKSILR